MPPKKGKAASSTFSYEVEESGISVTLKDLIKVQAEETKLYLEAALSKQADDLKSHFDNALKELYKKVDDLKQSLEFSQQDITELKSQLARQQEDLWEKDEKILNLQTNVSDMRKKLTYQENQSRRNNLRVNGIPEDKYETWEKTEDKLKIMLMERLDLDTEPAFERVHRVGRTRTSDGSPLDRPRTIVCKLYDWKVKEAILRSARKVKPEGIYVSEDLAEETLKRRKELLPKLKDAKDHGKIAYFVLDKLIIKDKPRTMLRRRETPSWTD